MPREGTEISETGNWNVADQYSKGKIMKPLNLCDIYEDIASYGYESIIDQLASWQAPPNDHIRLKALERLIKELIRLIDNAKFALKKKGTKAKALKYRGILEKIKKETLPKLQTVRRNQIHRTSQITIANSELFDIILQTVTKIKSKINEPLNANHLIFTDKEEFNPRDFKNKLKDRMVNQG